MEIDSEIRLQDEKDPLKSFRNAFFIPKDDKGNERVYLTGNSLGLQPKEAKTYLLEELEDWAKFGVEGHVHARRPWVEYHSFFSESLARIMGAKQEEVVAMNGLTANLHLLMVSFFRPKGKRTKLLCEGKAFPSDLYALRSQLRFHGLDDSNLVLLHPREGEQSLRTEDILAKVHELGDTLALSMLGAVNFYTGQFFEIQKITQAIKAVGAFAGWDLAHAAGNLPLELHKWDVDCAAWCSYKYMNSGPGGVSGIFIHEKHHALTDIPRFEGWWGHDSESRFKMPDHFQPMPTAEAWQLSNAPILSMAAHRASLDLFDKTSMQELRIKSLKLTAYLEEILNELGRKYQTDWSILSPIDPEQRGCQLSLLLPKKGRALFDYIQSHGVTADWREPDVIRLAPVPMYNSFGDLNRLKKIMIEFYETH